MKRKGHKMDFDYSPKNFDAVIFDLDGVLTDTAKVHASAWKILFDDFLNRVCTRDGSIYRPFSLEVDYPSYVDGKPRYEGVISFLNSRGIKIPINSSKEPPELETVYGLGNRKDIIFNNILNQEGVDVFDSSLKLINDLKSAGIRCGVASSSKNCKKVLQITGIDDLFEARVDGIVSEQLNLNGKPAPDIFLKCSEMLAVSPERAVVVEDAISGVQAGKKGGFLLVIGMDRANIGDSLKKNGADIVLTNFSNVNPSNIDEWCETKKYIV